MTLTTTQRREYLDALGMSQRGFAALLGWNDRTVRRWMTDHDAWVPPEIDAWLERRGKAAAVYNAQVDADPVPVVEHKPGRRPSDDRAAA